MAARASAGRHGVSMHRVGKWQMAVGCAVVALVIVVAAVPLGVAVIHGLITKPNISFNRSCLNAVVEQVKVQGMRAGGRLELRLENLCDPRSLRPRRLKDNDRGKEAGNVWVSRAPTGELTVIVETVDNGHAGRSGYVYSERPPHQEQDGRYEVGGEESDYLGCTDPGHKVADKWWEVWNCEMD